MRDLDQDEIASLRNDVCPLCICVGLIPGPRAGGTCQNLRCPQCRARFNVFQPRYILLGQLLEPGK